MASPTSSRAVAAPALRPPVLLCGPSVIESGRDLRARGRVALDLLIAADGHVVRAVADPAADPRAAMSAKTAALALVYRPARRGEEPVSVWTRADFLLAGDGRAVLDPDAQARGTSP